MSRIIHRFGVLCFLLALGLTAHAKVNFSLAFDRTVVAGYPGTVNASVLVSNDGATPVQVNNLIYSLTIPKGFTFSKEGITDGKLLQNNEVLNSGKHTTNASGVNFKAAAVIAHSKEAIFTVPSADADLETRTLWTIELKYDGSLTYGPKAFGSKIVKFKYLDEKNIPVDIPEDMYAVPASVNLDVKDGFNFGLAKQENGENVQISGREDNVLNLDPANAAIFNATLCDDQGVETSTDKVKFTANTEVNTTDVAASIDEAGKLTLTPKKDYYGTVTINYEVICSALESNNVKSGTFDVTITPVDDPTIFTISNVNAGTEGSAYTVSLAITDVDTDDQALKDKFLNKAYGIFVDINGVQCQVTEPSQELTQDLTVAKLPFNLITGSPRAKSATYPVKVVFAGPDANYESNVISPVTFSDVDQPVVELSAPAVTVPEGPYYTNTKIVIDDFVVEGNFSDADGDEIKAWYYWTKDGEKFDGATITPAVIKKGDTWIPHVRVFTQPYGEDVDFKTYDGEPITIADAPTTLDSVTKNGNLFIQKGSKTECTFVIKLSDADISDGQTYGKSDITIDPAPAKGTLSEPVIEHQVSDSTCTISYTYSVTDTATEFDAPDTFTFTVGGVSVPMSVNYKDDPAPEVTVKKAPEAKIKEGEDAAITAEISVADSNTAVAPSGVKSVVWSMTLVEGNTALESLKVIADPIVPSKGDEAVTSKATVKVPFNVLDGRARAAKATYTLTATFKDGNGAEGSQSWTVEIYDTDQAPVITEASLTNSVAAEAIFTGTEVTVTAAGATDPDGDDIAYYTFNGDKADEKNSIKATNLTKGDKLSFDLIAYSQPAYSKEGFNNSETKAFTDQIIVLNSAPTVKEEKTVTNDEVDAEGTEVSFNLTDMAVFEDIDVNVNKDTLTYSVGAPSEAKAGTLAIDEATGMVTYKPAKFYVGTFTFDLTATDEDKAAVTATVTVTVNPVNSKPIIKTYDIYHVPSDCDGTTHTATFEINMGGGEDEKAQTIDTAAITEVLNGLDLDLTTESTVTIHNDVEPRTISFQYTLTSDTAEKLGKETIVKLQVKDDPKDGTTGVESDVAIVKIILGASPWYPAVENTKFEPAGDLVADGSKAYMVDIMKDGSVFDTIKIAGNNIKAADYLDYTDGLLPGDYTYSVFEWNPSTGKGTVEVAKATVAVDDYNLAAKPSLTANKKTENTYDLTISAPMASMYLMEITTPAGETIQTWNRFKADATGIIKSEETVEKGFYEAGDYTVKVAGWNPKMGGNPRTPGEFSDPMTITIAAGADENPVFPEVTDGDYRPADNKAILVDGAKQATVDFAWPNISTKAEYTLYVYTASGQAAATVNTGAEAIASVTLDASLPVNHYMWRVSAVVNGKTIWSKSLAFKLVTSSQAPLITGVALSAVDPNTLVLDFETFSEVQGVTYDVMGYDVDAKTWTKLVSADFEKTAAGQGKLVLPAGFLANLKAGDYIYLRVKVNGKAISVSFEDFALKTTTIN